MDADGPLFPSGSPLSEEMLRSLATESQQERSMVLEITPPDMDGELANLSPMFPVLEMDSGNSVEYRFGIGDNPGWVI